MFLFLFSFLGKDSGTPQKRSQKPQKRTPKRPQKRALFRPQKTPFCTPPPPGTPQKTPFFPYHAEDTFPTESSLGQKHAATVGGGGGGGKNQLIWGGGILENRSILSRGRGVFGGHFAPFCVPGFAHLPAVLLICYNT